MTAYFDRLTSRLQTRGVIKRMGLGAEKDDAGQYPAVEETVAAVWCQVVPQTGSLLSGRPGETQLARTTHKIVMRYRPDITPDMWVEAEGERYDILYVMDPYLKHVSLELFCEVRWYGDQRGTGSE